MFDQGLQLLATGVDQLDDFVTVNMNVFFDTDPGMRLNFAVTNLLDRIGQEYFGFIYPGSESDDIGRRFTASVRMQF